LIYSIIFFHITIKLRKLNLIYVNILVNFFLFTFLVKFNFISSVHNFVTLNASFQFFFEMFIFFSVVWSSLMIFKFFKKKNYPINYNVNILSYLLLALGLWSYLYIIIDFFFIFNDRGPSLEIFIKDHRAAVLIILVFFLIFYEGFVFINIFYLTFIEYVFNLLLRFKVIKFDFLHLSFFSFFVLTNLTYFFPDFINLNKNLLKCFYISNSNFFDNCCTLYTTKNPYNGGVVFTNNSVFYKNIIILEQVFLEFFSSNSRLLLNLNLLLLLKISIFIQACMFRNCIFKTFFYY